SGWFCCSSLKRRWQRSSQRRSRRSLLLERCGARPRWVFPPRSAGADEARHFHSRAYISPALLAQPIANWDGARRHPPGARLPLFLSRKTHARFTDGQIARIENLWHNVGTMAKLEVDEVCLAVFQFVEGGCFHCICLDVGEFVVMVDCADREGFFIALKHVGEAQSNGIFRAISVQLARNRLFRGSSALAAFFFGKLDLSAIILDFVGGNESGRAIHGGSHGIFLERDEDF